MNPLILTAVLLTAGTASAIVCDPTCCELLNCGGGGGGQPAVPCYETKTPLGNPSPRPIVTDEFGAHTLVLDYLRELCTPIAPAPLGGTHQAFYGTASDSLPAPKNDERTYMTPLGAITATIGGKVRFLQTDAEKGIPPADAAPFVPGSLRTCYAFEHPHPNFVLDLTDQFGDHTGVAHEAALLCLPAASGAQASTTTRVCFAMGIGGPDLTVNLHAPFGPATTHLAHTTYWCVTATLLP